MAEFDIANIKPQVTSDLQPGDLVIVAGPASSSAPKSGRLICDGSVISKADQPDVFSKLAPTRNSETAVVEYIEKEGFPAPPSGSLRFLTEKHIFAAGTGLIEVSSDDGTTWDTFNVSGNMIWHFDAGSHLIIYTSTYSFYVIDKSDVLEPTQWSAAVFTRSVHPNNSRYWVYDEWKGYFYGIVAAPSTGVVEIARVSLRSILNKTPDLETKTFSTSYSVWYDMLDVANGRVLLLDQGSTNHGASIEVSWASGSLVGAFNNSSNPCYYQVPMPNHPGARWAQVGTGWVYQYGFTALRHAMSVTGTSPLSSTSLVYTSVVSSISKVLMADRRGHTYVFSGGSITKTAAPFPLTANTQPMAHLSGFTFLSSFSNGFVGRFYYHGYDMTTERVLPSTTPDSENHYEIVI